MRPLLLLSILPYIYSFGGYSQEQLDLYDLYDELRHTTFYKFMNLEQSSTKREIKSAYRKKVLAWHPDKVEPSENETKEFIELRFRQVTAVKDYLIDEEMRKEYDNILKNGLPPGMSFRYYRYIMKMSVKQVLLFCFLICWLVHYLCLWGSYLDKKMIINDQSKRSKKKAKQMDTILLAKPVFGDTLPFLLWKFAVYLVTVLPSEIKQSIAEAKQQKLLAEQQKLQEQQDLEEYEKEKERKAIIKKENQIKHQEYLQNQQKLAAERYETAILEAERRQAEMDSEYDELDKCWSDEDDKKKSKKKNKKKKAQGYETVEIKTGPWEDEEKTKMIELMNKWPGGTPDRWDRIAEELNRSTIDVTKMLKQIKNTQASGKKIVTLDKTDTANQFGEKKEEKEDVWSKEQQGSLEQALRVFGKNYKGDKWEAIADCVAGKSKRECMERFKIIAMKLKAMKG